MVRNPHEGQLCDYRTVEVGMVRWLLKIALFPVIALLTVAITFRYLVYVVAIGVAEYLVYTYGPSGLFRVVLFVVAGLGGFAIIDGLYRLLMKTLTGDANAMDIPQVRAPADAAARRQDDHVSNNPRHS